MREADAVIVAAGFRFSLERLGFLAENLRTGIALEEGRPVLDRFFRSSDEGLLFVGFAAEHRFGPLARFIPGRASPRTGCDRRCSTAELMRACRRVSATRRERVRGRR